MRIEIHNLGRIGDATIGIAPLTVFFGRNGTQKTWAAHSYFKLLEQFRLIGATGASAPYSIQKLVQPVVSQWLGQLEQAPSSDVTFTIERKALLHGGGEINSSIEGSAFRSAIGTDLPREASVALVIDHDEFDAGAVTRLEVRVSADRTRIERALFDADELLVRTTSYRGEDQNIGAELELALNELALSWRNQVRALPAERVNLVQIFPFIVREKQLVMPRALIDFCFMMANGAAALGATPRPVFADSVAAVVQGEFTFVDRELRFLARDGSNSADVPIKAAASFAKSLAGLSVFLAGARPGDALIIDEPEMNAHPDAQLGIAELFATMVRKGIHILAITHSPYFVEHISSLIEASRIPPSAREELRDEFALKRSDVFLNPNEVAVYEFRGDGNVVSVFNRETGDIDWSTFTDVNDQASALSSELAQREPTS